MNIRPAASSAVTTADDIILGSPVILDDPLVLWRDFATNGYHANMYHLWVPFAPGRYADFMFSPAPNSVTNNWGIAEGVAVENIAHASLTKTGTWGTTSATGWYYGGSYAYSSTAASTIYGTVTGHTLLLRCVFRDTGGFGLVSIDGDDTAASAFLPVVTQTEVDAGWFVSGDIGKCYLDWYASSIMGDEWQPIAEGLADEAHTVTITVKGTKRTAATNSRVMVTAFAGATDGLLPTADPYSVAPVYWLCNPRTTNPTSATGVVMSYDPTGGSSNYQWLGEIHGNETQTSATWAVDGVTVAPAAGDYNAGDVVTLDRVTSLNHPDQSGAAIKRARYQAKIGERYSLKFNWRIAWATAGTVHEHYPGMMPAYQRTKTSTALEQTTFDRVRIGSTVITALANDDDDQHGMLNKNIATFYDTTHDATFSLYMDRADLNVNNWALSSGRSLYLADRADHMDKIYFTRSTELDPESVVDGSVHEGVIEYIVRRIQNASTALGS